jgi:diacylglycerol kinase
MGGVFAAEMVNTSAERLVDLVSPEYHNLAKFAKDAAAGGVLIMAIFASITGLLIFVPKVLQVVSH